MKNNYFVAITGCSGCGKTSVLNVLNKRGYNIIDCDIFSVQLIVEDKSVIKKIEEIIRDDIYLKDKINLKKIGDYFDKNQKEEEAFEEWYQYFLGCKIKEFLLSINSKGIIFVDIPFLSEKGISNLFNEVWVIESNINLCYERIKRRNNYGDDKIKYLINRSLVKKDIYRNARRIIQNNDSIIELEKMINLLSKELHGNIFK